MTRPRWALHFAKALGAIVVLAAVLLLGFLALGKGDGQPPGHRKVILIRHGEKEGHKGDWGNGLSFAGKMRAQCLAARYADLGVTNLFAFDNKPTTRPVDTLKPLATQLGIKIDTQFKRGQTKKLARYIFALPPDSLSVICWQHDIMGKIAEELGVASEDIPEDLMNMPGDSWDKQWSIYYDDSKGTVKAVSILEEQQHCTYGDHYYERIYWFWIVGAGGVPFVILLGYWLFSCSSCRGRKEDAVGSSLLEEAVEDPLLDEVGRC